MIQLKALARTIQRKTLASEEASYSKSYSNDAGAKRK